ncbi:MAG: restriction endonuclease subunit S [Oscillospiraceae bacterium]|nr:restriction endonuclease subunit S [Oscillospiraceae bacterium]
MALVKYKLGELISLCDDRNSDLKYGINDVKGISIQKIFIETKADMSGVSLKPYILVEPDYFAYVTVTSRNGEKITIAHNDTNSTYIVSSSYVVFKVKRTDLLDSDYLFMYFNRPEFDRYARFNSWGSARETFSWEEMCDIDIDLPPLSIQQKYVAIYKAMLANQQSYERGLEDLKLVCDAYIEDLRRKMPCEEIKPYINELNERNIKLNIHNVQGVNSSSTFDDTKANMTGIDIHNYKIVRNGQFAYNPSRINLGSIALLQNSDCVVSPMYIVFEITNKNKLLPEYLMMWYSRKEFQRSTLFYATGSVRDTFDFDVMQEVKIPIPDIEIQQDIVNIYQAYIMRKEINEQLKTQIKNICSVLIKGSVEEGAAS